MFVLIGFDTYLLPSELLSLRKAHVSPPSWRAGPQFGKVWTICIAPTPEEYRTKTGLADVYMPLGDKRPFILELFALFYRNSNSDRFDLDFAERHFKRAVKTLKLPIRATPHIPCHSGPMCDRFENLRSLVLIRIISQERQALFAFAVAGCLADIGKRLWQPTGASTALGARHWHCGGHGGTHGTQQTWTRTRISTCGVLPADRRIRRHKDSIHIELCD